MNRKAEETWASIDSAANIIHRIFSESVARIKPVSNTCLKLGTNV